MRTNPLSLGWVVIRLSDRACIAGPYRASASALRLWSDLPDPTKYTVRRAIVDL